MKVKFRKFDESLPAYVPEHTTAGSAGLDLCAAVSKPVSIEPSGKALIGTNLIIELPEGFEGQVRPRSGLALRHGVTVLNSPGTVDSDYRGEVKVLLINHGTEPFTVNLGDRIAQLVVARYERISFEQSEDISDTPRGEGGYGSTGVSVNSK